jgi:DNA-binding response OmpR family regulator
MKILLVGESTPLLRILQVVSVRAGFAAEIASTSTSLREQSQVLQPDLLVFDHIHPLDLYLLNPRLAGFDGPVLMLTDNPHPETALFLLGTDHILLKPFHLDTIVQRLHEMSQQIPERASY